MRPAAASAVVNAAQYAIDEFQETCSTGRWADCQ
jgi:hypothetical protein